MNRQTKFSWIFTFLSALLLQDIHLSITVRCERHQAALAAPESSKAHDVIDYIVVFQWFYTKIQRWKFLRRAIEQYEFNYGESLDYSVVPRDNVAYKFLPSDFEIVRVSGTGLKHPQGLERHPLVKSVSLDKYIRPPKLSLNSTQLDSSAGKFSSRRLLDKRSPDPYSDNELPQYLKDAVALGDLGETGKGISVAVFDTGISSRHRYLRNLKSKTQWTDDVKAADSIGHGTFVTNVIASTDSRCPGIAPDVDLHVFKVFNKNKVSRTSWFLDAFNYAMSLKVDVINLSIGGPDFEDRLFVEKVSETVGKGIVFVSAIGNDGPGFGTLNNPADQVDVIGVGATTKSGSDLAPFSSRGMTTWEMPFGYGRVKPDLVTVGVDVRGVALKGVCTSMQGTSVASPIVTGSVALLLSALRRRNLPDNPSLVKQLLTSTAEKIGNRSMFEQGAGKMRLRKAFDRIQFFAPHVSINPKFLDTSDPDRFMWPFNEQPLYYSGMPLVFNVTVTNSFSPRAKIDSTPVWHPADEFSQLVSMSFHYPSVLWPWSGYLGIQMFAGEEAKSFNGVVRGVIAFNVTSFDGRGFVVNTQQVSLPVKLKLIQTPKREHRILWDQFHNLKYPNGYFPRDNFEDSHDILDWHGDHPHTNFKSLFELLSFHGFFVEVLKESYNCFNASNYKVLLVVDSEDFFFQSEIEKIYNDVMRLSLSLIVVSDWWNEDVMDKIKYFDENTRIVKYPLTGGANVPALNDLLKLFNISLSNHIYNGQLSSPNETVHLLSSGSILSFPSHGYLARANLNDQAFELLHQKTRIVQEVPFAGFVEYPSGYETKSGSVAVLTDSSCLEDRNKVSCFTVFYDMLKKSTDSNRRTLSGLFRKSTLRTNTKSSYVSPNMKNLTKFSRVVMSFDPYSENIFELKCLGESINIGSEVPLNAPLVDSMIETGGTSNGGAFQNSTGSKFVDSSRIGFNLDRKVISELKDRDPLLFLLSVAVLTMFLVGYFCRTVFLRRRRPRLVLRRTIKFVCRAFRT